MGERIIRELNCRYVTFGFSPQADIRPLKYQFSLDGIKAQLQTPRGKIDIQSSPGTGSVFTLLFPLSMEV